MDTERVLTGSSEILRSVPKAWSSLWQATPVLSANLHCVHIPHWWSHILCQIRSNSTENNPVLLSQLSEDIPSIHLLCFYVDSIPLLTSTNLYGDNTWIQKLKLTGLENVWGTGPWQQACSPPPRSPTAMQLAATCLPPLPTFCTALHTLGEFCSHLEP